MKTLLIRPLITLTVAASVVFLAGCLEQTRHAGPPVTPVPGPVAPPVGEPAIISRPDPATANVSGPVAEVARLHLSGLDETVIKAFVERSTNTVGPTADELIYLRDIGVSPRVITVMIQQPARMREQGAAAGAEARANPPATAATGTNAPAGPPATVPAAPVAAAPAPPPVVAAPLPAPAPASPPADLPPEVATFYQPLQAYGTWMQVADYGWCWQPSVVVSSPSWRPYADRGRWLYTDQGWYWQSDYAWGWAPFHYGRWVHHTHSGWLWVPDSTWGPAWVVWRSSDSYCGWAPLPPSAVFVAGRGLYHRGTHVSVSYDYGLASFSYTFVPFSRFCDRNPHYYAVTPTVAVNVYHQTTVINNIRVNNNVIVNGGVNVDRVATLTRSEIRKVSVRDAAAGPQGLQRLDRLEKTGDDLVIYRPSLNPSAPVKPMKLTNEKGESRVELVPAGTLSGQKITGRPVYDTTSTGVPVLTGYTTEPPARSAGRSTVVINNNSGTTAAPEPVPATAATTAPTSSSTVNERKEPERANRIFGLTPGTSTGKRTDERRSAPPSASAPSASENSLFRPLTPPQPVTSTPRVLTPPQPVVSSPPTPAPAPPVAAYQAPSRTETPRPQPSTPSYAPASPSYAPKTTVQPSSPAPYAPAYRPSAPSTPSPTYSAPAPTRSAPSAPAYTPPPSRPAYSAPAPAAPAPSRPTVYVSPPPPSSAPASTPSNNSNPSKNDQEKKK